jgi:8-oxo-dGTP diphosphatase
MLDMKQYCLGFFFVYSIFRGRNDVLLIKRNSGQMSGYVNGLGGTIEAGETPAQAMGREFVEESGVQIGPSSWTPLSIISNQLYGYTLHSFYHVASEYPASIDRRYGNQTDEGLVFFCNFMELPPNTDRITRWLVPLAVYHHNELSQGISIQFNRTPPMRGKPTL